MEFIYKDNNHMTDDEKWKVLQKAVERKTKEEFLEAFLNATGLGEYIAKAIRDHEEQMHDDV